MLFTVLMSTYNGIKYIKEQLDSVFSQDAEHIEIRVIIRDDGSTDRTVAFCKEYAARNNVSITIMEGDNIGPAASFLQLIQHSEESDFYAFCDQDDVWLEGKVKAAVAALGIVSEPALWISNYDVVDSELKMIEKSALEKPEDNQLNALFYNNVPGCTMVFNKALWYELKGLEVVHFRMHDILTLCVALVFNNVLFDTKPYILYRQHSLNAIGRYSKKIHLFSWIKEKTRYLISNETFNYSVYAKKIVNRYADRLPDSLLKEYSLISEYRHARNRIKLLTRPYTKNSLNRNTISMRLRILLGKV